ncbi:unnamed protein product [Somion occarium]|uniref:SET domain-containing protein n=1 Tax=Somion occarium TaxID=3059160 RepID=A0ABP1E6M7_9APHY
MASARLETLLNWCAQNDINIDPRIELIDNPNTGICVYSKEVPINALETLVTIPKTAVLSSRSSSLAHLIPEWDIPPYGHGAHLALALALYYEIVLGPESWWFGYLQSLPHEPVGIALFWGSDELQQGSRANRLQPQQQGQQGENSGERRQHHEEVSDGELARQWSVGTEIDREQRTEDGVWLLDELREYYYATVEPLFAKFASLPQSRLANHPSPSCTLPDYMHAYSLVSSRAFLVDAYHGLSMVPIADAFNHSQPNHVHLESEYDVCVICGSLSQCIHDEQEEEKNDANAPQAHIPSNDKKHSSSYVHAAAPPTTSASNETDNSPLHDPDRQEPDTCDMCTNLPIPPRTEVFNTYGPELTNAQLLVRYGFALPSNDNDVVSWKPDELSNMMNLSLSESIVSYSSSSGSGIPTPPPHDSFRLQPSFLSKEEASVVEASDPEVRLRSKAEWLGVKAKSHYWMLLEEVIHVWPTEARWKGSNLVYNPSVIYTNAGYMPDHVQHEEQDEDLEMYDEIDEVIVVDKEEAGDQLEVFTDKAKTAHGGAGFIQKGSSSAEEELELDRRFQGQPATRNTVQGTGRRLHQQQSQSRIARERDQVYERLRGTRSRTQKTRGGVRIKPVFCINGDAKLSHHLWAYCALVALVRTRTGIGRTRSGHGHGHLRSPIHSIPPLIIDVVTTGRVNEKNEDDMDKVDTMHEILQYLSWVVERQVALEGEMGEGSGKGEEEGMELDLGEREGVAGGMNVSAGSAEEGEATDGPWGMNVDTRTEEREDVIETCICLQVVKELVRTVTSVCNERAMQLGRAPQMGELLDSLGDEWVKTRYAMEEVLSERAILESCKWSWQELGRHVCGDTEEEA